MSFLEKNLAAVEKWTPAGARRVREAQAPAGYSEITGTDGTATFALREGPTIQWLGSTSMPRTSAAPLVKSLDAAGAASGLGLSVGTGFEWAAFAAKLGSAQTIFIYETDAALVRLALSICDLAAQLETGKIILLVGEAEEAAEGLSRFLFEHVGHEAPSVLQPLPTLTGARRQEMLSSGEAMVRRALAERQKLIAELARRLQEKTAGSGTLAFVRGSRFAGERPVETFLREQSIPALRIDRHDGCSLAMRVQTLAERNPVKIVSDFFRAQLAGVPASLPVETWIPPLAGFGFWEGVPAAASLAPHDRIVVQAFAHRAILEEKGIPGSQIELRPLSFRAAAASASTVNRTRLALIGELPQTDLESLGITLPTHIAVCHAAREILREEYLNAHFLAAPDIVRRAMDRAKAPAGDTALKEMMLKTVRYVLLPAVPLLTLANELQRNEIRLTLIGDWPGIEKKDGTLVIPFVEAQDAWQDVALLVHFSPWGVVPPQVGEAIAAGVAIVSPQHPADGFAGALPSLLIAEKDFAHPPRGQFFSVLKSLLKEEKKRRQLAESAYASLQS